MNTMQKFEDQARRDARLYLLTHSRPLELTWESQVFYRFWAQQQGKTLVTAGGGRFEIQIPH